MRDVCDPKPAAFLKPCPFCGANEFQFGIRPDHVTLVCLSCGAAGPRVYYTSVGDPDAQQIMDQSCIPLYEKWNARKEWKQS